MLAQLTGFSPDEQVERILSLLEESDAGLLRCLGVVAEEATYGAEGMAAKLVRYSDNGSTLSAVNFPEVTLPEHEDSLRLLHIHQNVPGVLSKVNEIFSRHNVNIDGQFLRTDPKVGYVVIDITASEAQAAAVRDELAAIPGTLRTRILY